MNCPYCGKPMEAGRIEQPRGIIAWTPEGKRMPLLFPAVTGDCLILADPGEGPVGGSQVRAFLCRDCGKVIIDAY